MPLIMKYFIRKLLLHSILLRVYLVVLISAILCHFKFLAIFLILAIIRVRKRLENFWFSPFFMIFNSPSNHHNLKINQVYRLFWVNANCNGCQTKVYLESLLAKWNSKLYFYRDHRLGSF